MERLDAQLRERRADLDQTLERQRTQAEARISTAERLEGEALELRREELNRWSERWAALQPGGSS
jgi:hypothetical protein